MTDRWREVGDRVFTRRHAALDLNVGLVVGDDRCLVVDTRSSGAEGRELAAAVRRITPLPWIVVTTHAHFDHCFGTASFLPAEVWAHRDCATAIETDGERTRQRIARRYEQDGQPEVAAAIAATRLVVPDHVFDAHAALDVGGRRVELRHHGRGHTDHDLVVSVPDADVVFAGDLVEQGAPPQFQDGFPLDWPATLDALLTSLSPGAAVVPGHGDMVDPDFVRGQRGVLADAAARSAAGYAGGRPAADVAAELSELGEFALDAVTRAYLQLATAAGAGRGGAA